MNRRSNLWVKPGLEEGQWTDLGVKPGLEGQWTGLAVYRSNLGWRVSEHVSWTKVLFGGLGLGGGGVTGEM